MTKRYAEIRLHFPEEEDSYLLTRVECGNPDTWTSELGNELIELGNYYWNQAHDPE